MTKCNGSCSISINYLQGLKTSCVEALAEIFDFVAGLVQRVPKKPSIAKSDLQNSTARLWNLDFRYGCEYECMLSYGYA